MITHNQSPAVTYSGTKNTLWHGFVLPLLLLLSAFAIATAAYILMGKQAGFDQSIARVEGTTEQPIIASATSPENLQGNTTKPATLVLIRDADAVKYKENSKQ